MDATEARETRRSRRQATEQTEGLEPPASVDQPAEGAETKRRRSARRPDGQSLGVEVRSTVKLTVRLPVRVWWRLKHHMADRPDLTEGEVIAPLLDQYLGQFDYPKQPDWLLSAMRGGSSTEEVSAN